MEFLIGLSAGIGFFIFVAILLYVGYRMGSKPKVKKEKPSEQELTRQKELSKDFQAMMQYDLDVALGRKEVN